MGLLERAFERHGAVGSAQFLMEAAQFSYEKPTGVLCNLVFKWRHGEGVDVMAEDWDTLVLLDGCRYDMFADEHSLEGSLESRISKGRMSWEFMDANFLGRELHDTVYTTANPYVVNLEPGIFHAVIDEPLRKYWDEQSETVYPADVTKVALEAYREYSNKRHIIHYMQPHIPFLGELGQELHERINAGGMDRYRPVGSEQSDDAANHDANVWDGVRSGRIARREVKAAYRENLRRVLEAVTTLVENIDGRTVISADHGEMLGERPCPLHSKAYSHGKMPWNIPLCRVPWHVLESATRREIRAEPPTGSVDLDQSAAMHQLEALGYRT